MKIDKNGSIPSDGMLYVQGSLTKIESTQTHSTGDFQKYAYRSSNIHKVVFDHPQTDYKVLRTEQSPGIPPYQKSRKSPATSQHTEDSAYNRVENTYKPRDDVKEKPS